VGHRPGGHVADLLLELLGEIVLCVGGPGQVQGQEDLGAGLPGALAQHPVFLDGALAPVDIAGVVPLALRAYAGDVVAVAVAQGPGAPPVPALVVPPQPHRVHGGVDQQLAVGLDLPGFLEESEGKPGGDAEAHVAILAPPLGRPPVGRHLGRGGADLEEEAALVRRLSGPEIFDLDGVGRHLLLAVVDLDLDLVKPTHLGPGGEPPHHRQAPEGHLAQDAGDHDEGEEHPEEQVQQVVAGVHRRQPDADGDPDVPFALAGDPEVVAVGDRGDQRGGAGEAPSRQGDAGAWPPRGAGLQEGTGRLGGGDHGGVGHGVRGERGSGR
jgi:hypothetical protein